MARQRLRDDWLERIKAVWREFQIARKAADRFVALLNEDTTELPPSTRVKDADAMSEHLEGTYLIRLFAAFESGLRSYWETMRGTKPPVRDLIDSIAGNRDAPDDLRDKVHEVREYRNSLVHENEADVEPVTLTEARTRLCTFFARLPDDWKS